MPLLVTEERIEIALMNSNGFTKEESELEFIK